MWDKIPRGSKVFFLEKVEFSINIYTTLLIDQSTSIGKSPFDLFLNIPTFTFGGCIWETRRSQGGSQRGCIKGREIYWGDQEDPFASIGDTKDVTRSIGLGMINKKQRSHTRCETKYGYSWMRRCDRVVVRKPGSKIWSLRDTIKSATQFV